MNRYKELDKDTKNGVVIVGISYILLIVSLLFKLAPQMVGTILLVMFLTISLDMAQFGTLKVIKPDRFRMLMVLFFRIGTNGFVAFISLLVALLSFNVIDPNLKFIQNHSSQLTVPLLGTLTIIYTYFFSYINSGFLEGLAFSYKSIGTLKKVDEEWILLRLETLKNFMTLMGLFVTAILNASKSKEEIAITHSATFYILLVVISVYVEVFLVKKKLSKNKKNGVKDEGI